MTETGKSGEFVGLGRCLLRVLLLREDLFEITFHKIVGGGGIFETIWTVAVFIRQLKIWVVERIVLFFERE